MRYLPHTDAERRAMLAAIGAPSVDALFRDVPASARLDKPIAGLSLTQGELEVDRHVSALAAKKRFPCHCGAESCRGTILARKR